MRSEYGRSLIEIIGVMAIGAVMTVSAVGVYRTVRGNQIRVIANSKLEDIAKNVKILMEMRGDYSGVSVDYLIKAGAIKTGAAPIGGANWSIISSADGASFAINLTELSEGDCNYFTTVTPSWATAVLVNGYESDAAQHCFTTTTNQLSFIVE